MRRYPRVVELLAPVFRVAKPRGVGGAAPLADRPMIPGARQVKVVSFQHGQTARLR